MPRLQPIDPNQAPDPRLALMLRQWLVLGVLAVLLVPAARGSSEWLGSLPFWLLAAPACALASLSHYTRLVQSRTPSRLRSNRRRNSAMIRR